MRSNYQNDIVIIDNASTKNNGRSNVKSYRESSKTIQGYGMSPFRPIRQVQTSRNSHRIGDSRTVQIN